MPITYDVIVVGAGFAGLAAAHALRERGHAAIVLEAQARVGGRVESAILSDGTRIDTGGQFLCDDMPNVMALVRRYGMTLVRTPVEGDFILQPPVNAHDRWRIYREAQALRERMAEIDPTDPAIIGLSVAAWLAGQAASPDGADAFRSMIEGLWCRPLDAIPLWYLISNDRRITNVQSELEYSLAETMHSLAEDMGRELGGALRIRTPVEGIAVTPSGVDVFTRGQALSAREVIVAVPPVMASRIVFEPSLPAVLVDALCAWKSGTVIKALVRYPRPFWRDQGASGMVMWRQPGGLFSCAVSRDGLGAALVVFIGGPLATSWRQLAQPALREAILDKLAAALGDNARSATEISLRDWADDAWSGGGYSDSIANMRAYSAEDIIRAGAPRIHFACSEISPSFPGYVEGALVAGRAAVERLLKAADRGAGEETVSGI